MAYQRKFHYDLTEWEERADTLATYITVRAWDDDGHEVSITTNRAGEGLFHWVWDIPGASGHWAQDAGTLQFRLPSTAGGIRQRLALMLSEAIQIEG